jgi:tetratricopeptide (TPR) repeat protein
MEGTMSNHLDYEINKELGECYLFMGELEKAEEYYKKAANSNGVHPDPYLGLATIAVQRGKLDEALVLYKKADTIESSDKALAGMGLIHMDRGNHKEALEFFVRALEYNPDNMIAMSGMIQEGYALGCVADIVPMLIGSLEHDPNKDAVRFSLAGCLIWLGKNAEAMEHLELLLEKDPENEGARQLYEKANGAL